MAELAFEIGRSGGKSISDFTLRTCLRQASGLLREFDTAISGKTNGVLQWSVAYLRSNGSYTIGYESHLSARKARQGVPDVGVPVVTSLVDGVGIVDRDAVVPMYLSESGLQRLQDMVVLIEGHHASSFSLRTGSHIATVTARTGESLKKILPIRRTTVGSIEGRLVGINVERAPIINVIHHITGRSIKCVVDASAMDLVKKLLGTRVVIGGNLKKNERGETIRVEVRTVQERHSLARKEYLAAISALPIPEFANAVTTEDYLDQTRG